MSRQKLLQPIIREQSGVIILLLSVLVSLAIIIAIAVTAKQARDRQQLNKLQSTEQVR